MKSAFEEFDPLKIKLPATLESERLLLRPYRLSDAPALVKVFDDNRERLQEDFPSRANTIHIEPEAESFIWHVMQLWDMRESFYFCIWEKQSRLYVGEIFFTEIVWKIPKAHIGYYVVKEWEGKGLMTEAMKLVLPFAFETLKMRKLQIRCAVDNLRSQRVAERCGFKIEGVLRNDALKADGQTLANLVYYGMTPNDFRGKRLKPPTDRGFN